MLGLSATPWAPKDSNTHYIHIPCEREFVTTSPIERTFLSRAPAPFTILSSIVVADSRFLLLSRTKTPGIEGGGRNLDTKHSQKTLLSQNKIKKIHRIY
jgi:hypothetical protein